ncbi:MAG: alpha-glucan family phosphorylase [Phycisphaerales bacterium]|nr:alpha-glucan family phosphorylase [Phycisphaerales bacterium]
MAKAVAAKKKSAARAAVTFDKIAPRVERLARNLWWTWSTSAQRVFAALDPSAWEGMTRNPLRLLRSLPPERGELLAGDAMFLDQLARAEKEFDEHMKCRTWFDKTASAGDKKALIAYFCAEYAIHDFMPQYAGGLGVLAGDHVKSASDLGAPLLGVGLLYRSGYYEQSLAPDGTTRVAYPTYDFADWPVEDTGKTIKVEIGTSIVYARVWRLRVGRVTLVLLDSYLPKNKPKDRALTQYLYGGDIEHQIRRQTLLGVGGVRALDALNLRPTVYHINEGHAAFALIERLCQLTARRKSLADAIETVRASTVFTTHTPVPAGNHRYDPKLLTKTLKPYAQRLKLSSEQLLAFGREDETDKQEQFTMTVLALRLSARANGVAKLHGEVSREMWMRVYGAKRPQDVPIGHVTNGIHPRTWLAAEIEPLYDKYLKPRWNGAGPDDDWWRKVGSIPDAELWEARCMLRSRMVNYVRRRLRLQSLARSGQIENLVNAHQALDDKTLTIGFARRFATYKRAPLIFHDEARLAKILNDPKRPVQVVFAGKAHPKDLGGQAFVRQIFEYTQKPAFRGKVVLLENYDMQMGHVLTSGSDVWLNNPVRPQEASGTSGMKPPLHGGINCSIPDGWWPEAYDGKNGWMIGDGRSLPTSAAQDDFDANAAYETLEKRVVPLFYDRDKSGVPGGWVAMMKESMRSIPAPFSTTRMVSDYVSQYYLPAHRDSAK